MPNKTVKEIWRSMRGLCFGLAAANFLLITQFISTPQVSVRLLGFLIAEIPILIAAGMLYELLHCCEEPTDTILSNWASIAGGVAISSDIIVIASFLQSFHTEFFTAGAVGFFIAFGMYLLVMWIGRNSRK